MSKESRFIARVLRHSPQDAGITLGPGGWVSVADLLRGMRAAGHRVSRDGLTRIVEENDKRRFTLSSDGQRIRAAQGHSVEVDLGLAPARPPETLFHGTATRSLDGIFRDGIISAKRQSVHLSADEDTAMAVGARHGSPVVLAVAAGEMFRGGHEFRMADNGVWLTDRVPPERLFFAVKAGPSSSCVI